MPWLNSDDDDTRVMATMFTHTVLLVSRVQGFLFRAIRRIVEVLACWRLHAIGLRCLP